MKWLLLLLPLVFTGTGIQAQDFNIDSVPVRISSLDARYTGNSARLDWKVVCLLDYAKFEIQRSADGKNYITIGEFEADQLRCRQPFDFSDAGINGNAFYRIRVGDIVGRVYHSRIVAVTGKEKDFEINSLTPTAITSTALLSLASAKAGNAQIEIANFNGLIINRVFANLNKGTTDIALNLSHLPSGNYILSVTVGNAKRKTVKFSKL